MSTATNAGAAEIKVIVNSAAAFSDISRDDLKGVFLLTKKILPGRHARRAGTEQERSRSHRVPETSPGQIR